ncbi:alpha/beta-hydrolase [Aureobasidium subglaciale]|nr:alpha/beta-hydrolase [Aureobasidium subglaciale]
MATSIKVAAAKIVEQRTHQIPGKLRVTEHFFDVPKDYSKPETGTIRIFARSVRKHESPADISDHDDKKSQLPWMVFLNGGPGGACRHPSAYPFTYTVLDKGYQMLYLDQRGTGLSTPITPSTLGLRGDEDVQARYLKHFRADSIVRDCEAIRQSLTAEYPPEKQKWSIMGQSFGGFCSITYLSFYPQGLREAFIYGGLQPLVKQPDPVYRALYNRVAKRNQNYYDKYPEDVDRVKNIVRFLTRFGDGTIKLPSSGNLTARRFQQIGIMFGMHGGIDAVHEVVLRAAYDIEAFGLLTRGTLTAIESITSFDEAPIYAILHEQIYCEGQAPNWSAERMRDEFPEFELKSEGPTYFTGEMVFSWMFDDYSELRKIQDVAERVAADSDWPALFDEDQLHKNEVPVYAAVYQEDMYVDYDYSMETAGKIKGCKKFITNVMYHNAIRSKADEVVRQLFDLRDDVID